MLLKIYDFRLKSPFISKTVRARLIVVLDHLQEVIGGRFIRVNSDDLEKGAKTTMMGLPDCQNSFKIALPFRHNTGM